MRIILATRFYPPDTGGGGIATYAHYAAVGLQRAGYSIKVISSRAKGSLARQKVNGIDVYRITPPFSSYRWSRLPLVGRHMRFIRDLAYAWHIRKLLLEMKLIFQPDIVEYADIDAESFFHPISICPRVVKLHTPHSILKSFYTSKQKRYAQDGIEWMELNSIRSAQGISSPSVYLAKKIAERAKIEPGRIHYVPNFIDTDFFCPESPKVENAYQHHSILYVGRLEPLKGVAVLAKAIPIIARIFRDTQFVFLGADRLAEDGKSQKSRLEQYFENEDILGRVKFIGHNTPEVFLSFYRKASIFVLPSFYENSPYTLLEAMACAKPCVVSRAGGMQEMVVDQESGLFFEPGNSEDLAEKILQLLQRSSVRKTIGYAARQRIEREYSLITGVEKTLSFYNHTIAKENRCE